MHHGLKTMHGHILFIEMFSKENLEHVVDEHLKVVKIHILGFDIGFGPWISPSKNMYVVLRRNPTTMIIKIDINIYAHEFSL